VCNQGYNRMNHDWEQLPYLQRINHTWANHLCRNCGMYGYCGTYRYGINMSESCHDPITPQYDLTCEEYIIKEIIE
jgi:hypothetical protein